jgi:hypothetical protein
MSVSTECPHCGQKLRVLVEYRDKLITCPNCRKQLLASDGLGKALFEALPADSTRPRSQRHRRDSRQPIAVADGLDGSIELWPGKVIIRPVGTYAFLTRLGQGDQEIRVSSITSVDFRRQGIGGGYIRFSFAGGSFDYKTIWFHQSRQEEFEDFKEALDSMMDRSHQPAEVARGMSVVEELERLVGLLEKGHITREEFNQRKKQILG